MKYKTGHKVAVKQQIQIKTNKLVTLLYALKINSNKNRLTARASDITSAVESPSV